MTFATEDNWDQVAGYLRERPRWVGVPRSRRPVVFEARVGDRLWQLRQNDFPSEPSLTLLVDGEEVIHFNDWPLDWGERPAFVA
jgi:hypothetical protein